MEKKKKILVIVIVLSVLLVALFSQSFWSFIGLIRLLQGVQAFISEHLKEAVIFLFGGIGLGGITMVLKWYLNGKKQIFQKKRLRVIKMLSHFINPLIEDLEGKIHDINDALDREKFGAMKSTIYPGPNYKFAFTDILGNENYEWIKGKVNEYNNSVYMLNDTISKFFPVIEESIKRTFSEKIEIFEKDMYFFVYHIANNDKTLAGNPEDPYGFWNEHIEEILAIRDSGETLDKANEIKQRLSNAKNVASDLKTRLEKNKREQRKKIDCIDEDEIEVEEGEEEVRS